MPAETHSAVFPFQNLDHRPFIWGRFLEWAFLTFTKIMYNQLTTQEGIFSKMGFLGWDFLYVFPDKCSNDNIQPHSLPQVLACSLTSSSMCKHLRDSQSSMVIGEECFLVNQHLGHRCQSPKEWRYLQHFPRNGNWLDPREQDLMTLVFRCRLPREYLWSHLTNRNKNLNKHH